MKLNYKRTFFVGLAFMSICAFWQVYDNVIPLILKDTFHVRDSYIGIVMAMDNVLALFMLPLFGKLSDKTRTKIGRRMPYILGGTILALLCLAIMPAAQKQNNALLFFIGLGLVLIAMATYRSPAVALMPDVTPKPLRSQGNAVINLMGAVGGMLMLLTMMIFPVTGDTPRYSAVFLVLGLVMAVCVAVLFWQIREPACVAEREAADRAAGSSDEDEGVTDAGGKMPRPMFRSLLFILASVFFWFFGYNAVTSAFSRYAEQELQGNFALVLMICTVAAIVSYMPVGMIAQRIGRKRTILIGIVMLGTAFFAGIFFHSVSPLLYIFFALDKALLAMKKIAIKVEMAVGVFMSSASMILQAGIGITIFVGAILLTQGQIELLPLLMFLLMVTRIYGPILAILANLSSLLNLNVVTSRMRTLLTTPAMDGEGKTVPNCDIELSHVTFAYNQEDVIKDVSCKIPQGSVTALVGPSGSGKSTISKLIARFWDVQQGKITVGGKDIKSMEPESLMSYMSFVFQDVTLFNDTVMNNIRLGNPNATDNQVIAAAKAAYCDEFVREMPDGYQTVLGENGNTLSGGERQRISIARALLKNAPIILLDEATASLDSENEVLVQKAIARLVEGKTVIMIAHRLRTVVDADQILVLDNGRLVEHGTHDELMKKNGLYHKLFHIQQESLGWAV